MNQESKIKLTAEISATSQGLVNALKQASGAVSDATGDWKAKFSTLKDSTSLISQSVKNLGDLVKKVGDIDMDVEGMDKISASVAEVTEVFGRVQGEVEAFKTSLVSMQNEASALGMPVEEYQRFADAVHAAGLSMGEGKDMILGMRQSILDLANDVPQVKDTFAKLGLTVENLSSNTATANFDAIVQALQSVIQPTEQARASMELFKTSMEHAVNVSQEYNKLLVEQTNNSYATEKDVQQSISLASAVEKLGEQLGVYAGKAGVAGQQSAISAKSFEELFEILKNNDGILAPLYVEYANFVDKLKSSVTSTLDATAALKTFSDQVNDLRFRQEAGDAPIYDPHWDLASSSLDQLVAFIALAKDKIEEEYKAIYGIMSQRLFAGAPIETKELEASIEHVDSLRESLSMLQKIVNEEKLNGNPIDAKDEQMLTETAKLLDENAASMEKLISKADNFNRAWADEGATKAIEDFKKQVEEAEAALSKGLKPKFDTANIDEAQKKLEALQKQLERLSNKRNPRNIEAVNRLIGQIGALKAQMDDLQAKTETTGFKIRHAFKHPIETVKELIGHVREYINATNTASSASTQMGTNTMSQLKQVAGQLLGMGSAVAIIVKGFRTIGHAINVYLIEPWRKANEEVRKMTEAMTKAQIENSEKNIARFSQMEDELKKYAEILKRYNKEGKETDEVALERQRRLLENQYGIDVNPENLDAVMKETFDWSKNGRVDAIESQIRALQKLNEALEEEYKDRDSYWRNDFGASIDEKERGKQRMLEIRNEQGANGQRIMELREQLRMMGAEDNLGDWKREQEAEAHDEEKKEKEEAEKQATKALEDQKKALEEATRKLEAWGNSLDDNERQKNLRTILQKYEEAVKAGVDEKEAETVAVKAVTAMLEKEKADEEKKNAELLKAVEDRIKAYKSAYEAYVQADKAVRDAKLDYAKTQRDLANENRSERIAKRRERIQKALGRFGFTPYDGFSLDESSSARRERRRNMQLDASIAEKMAKAQAGGRVHWTRGERERIGEFQTLKRRDKELDAAQKQMDAATKQKQAAEQLQEAAKAIRLAVMGRGDAGRNLREAGRQLNEARSKEGTVSKNDSAERIFRQARGKEGLKARGVMDAAASSTKGYGSQLDTLHRDLQTILKKTFLVK